MHFTSIVISGGEFAVIAAIGCIEMLIEYQSIDLIKNFVGTSAGAILCTAICAGFSPKECCDFIYNQMQDQSVAKLNAIEVLSILDTYGCFSGENIQIFINRLLEAKGFNSSTTFIEFAKATGKNLVICGSNLTKERAEYFCVDNTPNMPISIALKISCTIPILFSPVTYDDCIYLDGLLFNNFPINYLETNLRDIFAINIFRDSLGKSSTFMRYLYNIVFSLQRTITRNNISVAPKTNIITLNMFDDGIFFDMDALEVTITREQIKEMYDKGRELAKESLESQVD